jgi:cell division protein FtsI (penicillin-binding protein 3)
MKPTPADKRLRLRTILIGAVFCAMLVGILAKAAYLQTLQRSWLSEKAAHQVTTSMDRKGKRGTIFDANLREMAVSVDVDSVAAYPAKISDPDGAARALASALSTSRGQIYRKLRLDRPFVWIKRQADPREASAIGKLDLTGIDFISEHKRFYPNTSLAAQLLGFAGVDGSGLEGLEYFYNDELQGGSQQTTVLRDALGRGFDTEAGQTGLREGHNLVLTIDQGIQFLAEDTLADTVRNSAAVSGIAVVLSPKTGAVMALAHYPFFNPNAFDRFDRNAWRNRAITDPYEPGSTMKIFTAAAALASGVATPTSVVFCENGKYRVGSHVIHDVTPQQWLSLTDVLRVSSNIGAAKIGELVGSEQLYATLREFGFGAKTGIDCPGESPGVVSPWQRWSKIDQCAIAFGQGISVTALQLAAATAAIANDGILMRPYIVQAVTDKNGRLVRRQEPTPARQAVSPEIALQLRRMMTRVVSEGGSGARAVLEGYTAAGKTGTAQKVDSHGSYAESRFVASFVGFAPAEAPEIVVLVMIDEPKKSHYGGVVAAPAFKRIAEETLHYLNVPPQGAKGRYRVSADHEVAG